MSDPSIPVKRYFPTQADAQAWCDNIHAWLILNNADYAADVAVYNAGGPGGTARWCFPQQDMKPGVGPFDPPISIGTNWYITIKDRCIPGVSVNDMSSAIEWTQTAILEENMGAINIEGTAPADMQIINPG